MLEAKVDVVATPTGTKTTIRRHLLAATPEDGFEGERAHRLSAIQVRPGWQVRSMTAPASCVRYRYSGHLLRREAWAEPPVLAMAGALGPRAHPGRWFPPTFTQVAFSTPCLTHRIRPEPQVTPLVDRRQYGVADRGVKTSAAWSPARQRLISSLLRCGRLSVLGGH